MNDAAANRKNKAADRIVRGTRNVFADLGYADAAERQAKLRLAHALNQVLDTRHLTQVAAARVPRSRRASRISVVAA
jgi:hypothetical protein